MDEECNDLSRPEASIYDSYHALRSDVVEEEEPTTSTGALTLGLQTAFVAVAAFVGAVLAVYIPESVMLPNVFAPGSLVRRPHLFPNLKGLAHSEILERMQFFGSAIVLETCATAAFAGIVKAIYRVAKPDAATGSPLTLSAALLPWMVVHDFVECTIFIAATIMGYAMLSFGLYWEVWTLYITWIMSCTIAETILIGPPTSLGVLCSALPLVSERFDIGKDKVFVCLCFLCGGVPGILLGIVGLLSMINARILLLSLGYKRDLARSYFSCCLSNRGKKTSKDADVLGCGPQSAMVYVCKAVGFELEECIRDSRCLFVIAEDLPIALCAVCLLVWHGWQDCSPFVLALLIVNATKVSGIVLAKYYVLQKTGDWDNVYRGEIRIWSTLGKMADCLRQDRAKLSCEIRTANRLFELGEYDEAASQSHAVWRAMSDMFGETDPRTLQALQLHAKALRFVSMEHARRQEAADLEFKCWDMMKSSLGEEHPQTLRSMDNYASSLSKLGRSQEAADIKLRCLDMKTAAFGDAHPETLKSMNNYANALDKLGRTEEAADIFFKCWEMRKGAMGETHMDTLGSMCNYAISLGKLGRVEEAAQLQKKCWNLKKACLGEAHTETLRSMGNYANSLGRLKRMDEASDVHRQCWELRKDVLGEASPETLKSLVNYINSLEKLGKMDEAADLRHQLKTLQSNR